MSRHVKETPAPYQGNDSRRLRAILDAEPQCVKLLTRDCRLLDMNPAGVAMIEAESFAAIHGQSLLFVVDPNYRTAVQGFMERVYAGESASMEFPITTLKGR